MASLLDKKITGATFTPTKLADFLSSKLIQHIEYQDSLEILDPACGDGELLISIGKHLNNQELDFSLSGFDSNQDFLEDAKFRITNSLNKNPNLFKQDFLTAINISDSQESLSLFENQKSQGVNNKFDLVIANPPYVRTQILGTEQAQALAEKFKLNGRVDLYYPFLIAMTESLKAEGIIGVITSNRYLSTKSGESVRKYLSENYDILEVIDLGDTKLFDAAVLPAIFIGKKKKNYAKSTASFIKLYEDQNGYNGSIKTSDSIYTVLSSTKTGYFKVADKNYKKTEGVLKYEAGSKDIWALLTNSEADWISKIDGNSKSKVGDHFKVRVGVKTTADKVFISDKWDDLGDNKPEEDLLKALISQENIDAWSATTNKDLKILYTHYIQNGEKKVIQLDNYPQAKKYFKKHKKRLSGRNYVINAGRNWYEIWVPQNPNYWKFPKLVFPDISTSPRFYFDGEGKIVNGNCYWIVAKHDNELERLLLIQGIANSDLMTKYHDLAFNNKLYSGRRRYFTQYVEKYPLPDINSENSKKIIEIVKKLNSATLDSEIKVLKAHLEENVAESFGVKPVNLQD
ncbi:MAG: N-6 DNA methylase [Balneola sp.]